MNRSEILGTAKSHIVKDREATHGKPENSFGRIAGLWSALLGHDVNAGQVALMLSCLKIARAWGNPAHADNWIDLAGYAACGGEIATTTNTPTEGLDPAAHIARRDAERAAVQWTPEQIAEIGTAAEPLSPNMLPVCECAPDAIGCTCPAAPASAPPDGLGDVSATNDAETAQGTPAARVCGGCRFSQEVGPTRIVNCANFGTWKWRRSTCGDWQPRSDLASLAARDATAWQGQDGGVE